MAIDSDNLLFLLVGQPLRLPQHAIRLPYKIHAAGGALLLGRHTVPFQHMLSIVFTLGVSIFGVLTVAR